MSNIYKALYLQKVSRDIKRSLSKENGDEDRADNDDIISENHLRNLQTYYTRQAKEKSKQPHISTIFREPDPEPEPEPEIKPKKSVRQFHVVETENPYRTSIIRVRPDTDDSDSYSVTLESGI